MTAQSKNQKLLFRKNNNGTLHKLLQGLHFILKLPLLQNFMRRSILKSNLSIKVNQVIFKTCLISRNKLKNRMNRTELVNLKYSIPRFWKTFFISIILHIFFVHICNDSGNNSTFLKWSAICCHFTETMFQYWHFSKFWDSNSFPWEKLLFMCHININVYHMFSQLWKIMFIN